MFDLKVFRKLNSFTQEECATYFGCKQSFISQIERGERSIPEDYISKIKADKKMKSDYPILTGAKGKYRCFEVDGDSMDDNSRDSICDRDIVLGREIKRELWKCKLHIKDWEFIIVHNDGITIKKIIEHEVETGRIKCHSLNPFFDDFELNLEDVIELYNVIKIVDRNRKR